MWAKTLRSVTAIVVLLALSITNWPAAAQTTNATLNGQVTDTSGAAIPNAKVVAVNDGTNVRYETKTNNDGIYVEPNLPPGTYHMEITKEGFKTVMQPGIELHVEDARAANYTLQVGSASETVTVQASTYMINTQDATVSTTIDRNFAENLPLNGRSFQTLLLLTPGTTIAFQGSDGGTFSVNGQRANTNNFTVDGVSANLGGFLNAFDGTAFMNGANPNLTVAGTTQGMVTVDALQEFKIQTSTYAPEFGRQPGGQVSLLTRSGTNSFHGTAFDYLRNDIFDANTWFNDQQGLPKGKERQNDLGGTLGGRILKDKTFFFFSYEGLRLLQPFTQVETVPSLCLRGTGTCPSGMSPAAPAFQPILNSFPIPNGTDFGNGGAQFTLDTSLPTNFDSYSVKIDHAIGKRFHIFGRYSDTTSDFQATRAGVQANLLTQKLRSRTLTLGTDAVISSALNNEARLNYSVAPSTTTYSQVVFGGAKPFDTSILFPAPLAQGATFAEWALFVPGVRVITLVGPQARNSQRQINILDNVSHSIGQHQPKWGVDYRRLFPINAFQPSTVAFLVLSLSNLTAGNLSQAFDRANALAHPIYTNFSAYVQDTWRVSPRLTLTYGLRWELNPTPGERDGLDRHFLNVVGLDNPATAALAPTGAPLYKTTYNNFAPRGGIAYQLRQVPGHETVIRGGVGLFYDLNSQTFAGNLVNGVFSALGPIVRNLPGTTKPLPFPVPNNVLTIPSLPVPPNPPFSELSGIDPNLKLPHTLEWNVSVEQALGPNQLFTASYVASAGHRLLQSTILANFSPTFGDIAAVRNGSSSNYQSLQLQFNRQLSHGLQVLASYTYSHSIDNASDGQAIVSSTDGTLGFPDPNMNRGNSDFDVRHLFRAAASYNIPTLRADFLSKAAFGGWSVDVIGLAQSGLPIDLQAGCALNCWTNVRPDAVPGTPLYLYGTQCAAVSGSPCPDGRGFNPAAFAGLVGDGLTPPGTIPVDANGFATRQGTLGRNVMRLFGGWQMDFAVHRQFNFTERVNLQFRGEFFNFFNHPNFGAVDPLLGDGTFGLATSTSNTIYGGLNSLYQIGGPRSVQLALKLAF